MGGWLTDAWLVLSTIYTGLKFQPDNTIDIGQVSDYRPRDLYLGRNLYLSSGAVINFASGDVLITHSSDTLTVSGGYLAGPTPTLDTHYATKGSTTSAILANNLITKEPMGFPDRTSSTLTNATTTITLAPASGSYTYYYQGAPVTVSVSKSVSIASAQTTWYIYFSDAAGTLTASTVAWSLDGTKVPVAMAYYDGTNVLLWDERHGIVMDEATHLYLHNTIGPRYGGGFAGTFTAYNNISIGVGTINDEDLVKTYSGAVTQVTRTYYNGTKWVFSAASSTLPYISGGNVQYNSSGTLTNATGNYHVVYWLYATNLSPDAIICIVGTNHYAAIASAQAEAVPTSLPTVELKLLYRVIVRNDSPTYTLNITDFRASGTIPSSGYTATSHGSLTGLSNDDHAQYLLVDGTRAMTGTLQIPSYTGTNTATVAADGSWHSIITSLNGIYMYEVFASYTGTNQHSVAHWIASNAYGNGSIEGPVATYGVYPLELKWTGTAPNVALQIRTLADPGTTPNISVRWIRITTV